MFSTVSLVLFNLLFHILQRNPLGFGIKPPNHNYLNNHHHRKENEWSTRVRFPGIPCEYWKGPRYNHRHDPMRGAAQSLSFGANRVRKDLADIDPDHGTLPEAMTNYVTHQQPEKHAVIRGAVENPGNPGERHARAHRTRNEQWLPATTVNDDHAHHGGQQVGDANDNGLHVPGDFGESRSEER